MKGQITKVFFKYAEDQSKIEAIAINLETKEEVARREVIRRHGDRPCKVLGRKYAFKKLMTHVLQNKILPGKEVEALWKSFGSMCKQPAEKLAY
jgi:hypothetical protein